MKYNIIKELSGSQGRALFINTKRGSENEFII